MEHRKYFNIDEDEGLHILKPLHGICDAGDYWGITFREHRRGSLGMTPLDGDPSLYIKEESTDIEGLLGSYVDDKLFAGTASFGNLAHQTQHAFESKELQWDNVEFVGMKIETVSTDKGILSFRLSQPEYTEKLREVPLDTSFEFFASVRAAVG